MDSPVSHFAVGQHQTVRHALDPLSPAELQAVVAIVRADPAFGTAALFEIIELKDPAREAVAALPQGEPGPRVARANIFRNDQDGVWRLVVSITDGRILTSAHLPDAKPTIQAEQFIQIEQQIKADDRFIAACARRGITDMSLVCVDPWSAGDFAVAGEAGLHLAHTFAWLRTREHDNFYAHPIEGLNAVLDIRSGRVLRVDDYGVLPIPMAESNYEAQFADKPRSPYKALDILQPDGPSFTMDGNLLQWDRWSVRIGFNAREALTLHELQYDGRPIVNRASIVEMVVPYGSPEHGHFRKNVFDIGEYGVGKLANSLELGCDCLGTIQYLDAHLSTMFGDVMTIRNAVCIHEEDNGIVWKHTDFRTERTETRRGRRLVISTIATVGNYEYSFNWYLFTDASIQFECKATGIINTTGCVPGEPGKYGREVAPGVVGQIHQHIFCARLDMAVDGDGNSVVESNTHAEPEGPENPYGNAFFEEQTVLATELAACRQSDPATHRSWKVINPNRLNHVGQPTGYRLEPSHPVTLYLKPDSPSGRRAAFARNQLWVTRFAAEERYPAGEFMNRSTGAGDISEMVQQDRSIENANVVLWHSFGLHHPVRPEDFPVQSCITTGFKLMPSGFFDRNPAIDLAPSVNASSCHAKASCCG